jgi:hypothetical protein
MCADYITSAFRRKFRDTRKCFSLALLPVQTRSAPNPASVHGEPSLFSPILGGMGLILRHFLITALLLFHGGAARAHAQPNSCYQFSTRKYRIEMGVSFPAPYEGRRLAVYRSSDPGKEVCLSINQGPSACTENFVGALAFVTFLVKRTADGKSAAASIRERVSLMDQSPGMPDRIPFAMSIRLVNGAGSDVQVFGYDESPLPQGRRAAEREAAKASWRRFRQELYMDKDRDPFAVIEWLHTITGIHILRADGPYPRARGRICKATEANLKGSSDRAHDREAAD